MLKSLWECSTKKNSRVSDDYKVRRENVANQNAIRVDGIQYRNSLSFSEKHQICDESEKKNHLRSFKFIRNYLISYDCVCVMLFYQWLKSKTKCLFFIRAWCISL